MIHLGARKFPYGLQELEKAQHITHISIRVSAFQIPARRSNFANSIDTIGNDVKLSDAELCLCERLGL
jgi:hypothetical protein